MIIATYSQLFIVSVFHHVSDTYNKTRLKIHTEIPHPGQIAHAFSDHRIFILLVRTVTFFPKIILNSSYIEGNNYLLLYELLQDLPYVMRPMADFYSSCLSIMTF